MNTDRIYVQIAECADRLERADMQLHDLHRGDMGSDDYARYLFDKWDI